MSTGGPSSGKDNQSLNIITSIYCWQGPRRSVMAEVVSLHGLCYYWVTSSLTAVDFCPSTIQNMWECCDILFTLCSVFIFTVSGCYQSN
jgi:hypothetical protein